MDLVKNLRSVLNPHLLEQFLYTTTVRVCSLLEVLRIGGLVAFVQFVDAPLLANRFQFLDPLKLHLRTGVIK